MTFDLMAQVRKDRADEGGIEATQFANDADPADHLAASHAGERAERRGVQGGANAVDTHTVRLFPTWGGAISFFPKLPASAKLASR